MVEHQYASYNRVNNMHVYAPKAVNNQYNIILPIVHYIQLKQSAYFSYNFGHVVQVAKHEITLVYY